MNQLSISIVVDNPKSWFHSHASRLVEALHSRGHDAVIKKHHTELENGDIAFLLSCRNLVPKEYLDLHKYSLVVHSSALPHGRGWSPLTWQILEGKNEITSTLFEAEEAMDAGKIFFQEVMHLEGHELLDELHEIQGNCVVNLCLKFVDAYRDVAGQSQVGEPSYYQRRRPVDSRVDIDKTLRELFNQFRVADNEQYPIFFEHLSHKYVLKIQKIEESN